MIKVTLDEVLAERNMTVTELAQRVGITQANMSNLKNGHARGVRFATLDAICRVLQCEPGQLIRYLPATDDPA
ncbi:helix-turn-helix domain-containing protein [Nigerium massiliense]|uniref:helix-turn-helix domain-containing protein n=1 Tax=Nigerium massiliense TaxID=1522317 RepID=UPI00058FF24F|nr:helix-turn-helix transcriptional regulator [Nigerium massiliense]